MSTILKQLSNGLYQIPFGVAIFYPLLDEDVPGEYGPGHRLGDCDVLTVTMGKTETSRKSKEHNVLTTVMTRVTDLTVTVDMTVMQVSPIVRAASMMSSVGAHSQTAEADIEFTIGDVVPGVYQIPDYGLSDVEVTASSVSLVDGVDYIVDLASGQIEFLKTLASVEVIYDRAAISDAFIAGIGSNTSLRGMLIFRGTNDVGPQSLICLRDIQVSASGARALVASGTDPEGVQLQGIAAPMSFAGVRPGTEIGYETDVPQAT